MFNADDADGGQSLTLRYLGVDGEAHEAELADLIDDVWRDGYKLDGVRLGGEGGPLKPGPGSPFLREDSKWRFDT